MEFCCPECNSNDVVANVLVHGFAYVDMSNGEVSEYPEHCDYDIDDLDEFICNDCGHDWCGEVPKEVFNYWREQQDEQRKEYSVFMEMRKLEEEEFKRKLEEQQDRMNNYNAKIKMKSQPKVYLKVGSLKTVL